MGIGIWRGQLVGETGLGIGEVLFAVLHGMDQRKLLIGQPRIGMLLPAGVDGTDGLHSPAVIVEPEVERVLDPRVGLCMDVGHSERAGSDPVKVVAKAGARLLDMHVKDLKSLTDKDSQCDVGDGKIPFPALFRALQKVEEPA